MTGLLNTTDKVKAALPELVVVLEDCVQITNEMVTAFMKDLNSRSSDDHAICDAHQKLHDAIQLLKGML